MRSILFGNDVHGVAPPDWLAGSFQLGEHADLSGVSAVHLRRLPRGRGRASTSSSARRARHDDPRRRREPRHGARRSASTSDRVYRFVFAGRRRARGARRHDRRAAVSVYPGMGDQVLIICFVVVVIGGIGSVAGALIGALLVGFVDTFGKVLLPAASPACSIYVLMAAILLWRPEGHCSARRESLRCAALLTRRIVDRGCSSLAASRCRSLVADLLRAARHQGADPRRSSRWPRLLVGTPAWSASATRPSSASPPTRWRSPRRSTSAALALATLPLAVGAPRRSPRSSSARSSLRTRGIYFIMVTLAFAQMVYYVFHDTKSAAAPTASSSTSSRGDARSARRRSISTSRASFYYVAARAALVAGDRVPRTCCCARRFGHALAGIRDQRAAHAPLGFPTYATSSRPS